MPKTFAGRWLSVATAGLLASLMIVLIAGQSATADHQPANKVAAAGSTREVLNANEGAIPVLQERVKVASPHDLILSLSSECSILTSLRTGDDELGMPATDTARAFGQLRFYIEVDGTRVPITTMDNGPSDPQEPGDEGEVVFCNREYQRTVTDSETNMGGVDTEEDFIRTRTANAFNWLALDVGFNYDDPANGNNVVDIVVFAEYTREPAQCAGLVPTEPNDACAQAIVGRRTLIAEPTNASIHEWVQETDPDGGN